MEKNYVLDESSRARYCLTCQTYSVYRVLGERSLGACKTCHTTRASMPRESELCDLADPVEAEFFAQLMDQCVRH